MDDWKSGTDLAGPSTLDARSAHEWRQMSAQVMSVRTGPARSRTNAMLESAVLREPQSPAAPAYRLWAADNLAGDGDYAAALRIYDETVKQAGQAAPLLDVLDFTGAALRNKAGAATLLGDFATAGEGWRALLSHDPGDAEAGFLAGLIAEAAGQAGEAATFYRAVAADKPTRRTEDGRELARRALLRLESPAEAFAVSARRVADELADAISKRDSKRLRALASATHFAIGPAGGHDAFEREGLPEQLLRDLAESNVTLEGEIGGCGEKRYVTSRGWTGSWFRGEIYLTITQGPRGWQWTGVALTEPTLAWTEHWQDPVTARMASGSFGHDLLAPWPAGQCFRAGGWKDVIYLLKIDFIRSLGWLGRIAFAQLSSGGGCGWGVPGFYYDTSPTHVGEDEFAIDFLRYDQDVPFRNVSGQTPVLAARDGMVGPVIAYGATGGSTLNRTHIYHDDPDNPSDERRYMTRYLHLDGPNVDDVSMGMKIYTGNRVGRMDRTGRPRHLLKHLHFSIHDRTIPFEGFSYGASIRPSPLSGVRLEDGDNATCVCSDNVELKGPRMMIVPSSYPVSNWVITPAAPSINKPTPTNVADQRFLLILSGVAIVEFKGNSSNAWLYNTVSLEPDITSPIQRAYEEHRIPVPREEFSPLYYTGFHVEQFTQSAGLSSIYNDNVSNDSGFAINTWRPAPYKFGQDVLTDVPYDRLFTGMQVDIGVRDSDAYIKRLSYHITLLGRIVFVKKVPEF